MSFRYYFVRWQARLPGEHRIVIVSLDGCRWDYPQMYHTPFLDKLGHDGVQAVMQPSFPSSTFPNHYTLATGLVPDHHGIIANVFYHKATNTTFALGKNQNDPAYWGGDPIWLTAKRQGKRVGVVYWPGSDVAIKGEYPDYWHSYAKKPLLTYVERVAKIEEMLKMPADKRPQLIMAYFDEPDHSGHAFGPESPETRQAGGGARRSAQPALERHTAHARRCRHRPHRDCRSRHGASLQRAHHTSRQGARQVVVRAPRDGFPTMVFAKKGCEGKILKALNAVPHLRAYRKAEVPEYLHFGTNENIGDIVVLTDIGFVTSEHDRTIAGAHGFDPTYSDMHVLFRACGPDFRKGYTRESTFRNVNVYPLLAHLLGITPSPSDGSLEEVKDMLAE